MSGTQHIKLLLFIWVACPGIGSLVPPAEPPPPQLPNADCRTAAGRFDFYFFNESFYFNGCDPRHDTDRYRSPTLPHLALP